MHCSTHNQKQVSGSTTGMHAAAGCTRRMHYAHAVQPPHRPWTVQQHVTAAAAAKKHTDVSHPYQSKSSQVRFQHRIHCPIATDRCAKF